MTDRLTVLTTAGGEAEAELIREWLTEAGIHSLAPVSRRGVRLAAQAPRELYVYESDHERALAVLNAEVPSRRELESLGRHARTQLTRPASGEPIEIPVPARGEVEGLLRRAAVPAQPPPDSR
jgi:hypothetical protein